MAFVVMALGTVFSGLVMRRDPESGLTSPIAGALKVLAIPLAIIVAAVEIGFMQKILTTTSLTGGQWLVCLGLALVLPVVVEVHKAIRRRRIAARELDPEQAVAPKRARTTSSV